MGLNSNQALTLPAQSAWLHNLCGTTWITSRSDFVIFYNTSTQGKPLASTTSFLRRSTLQLLLSLPSSRIPPLHLPVKDCKLAM